MATQQEFHKQTVEVFTNHGNIPALESILKEELLAYPEGTRKISTVAFVAATNIGPILLVMWEWNDNYEGPFV